jgi:tRNA-specific 2-thiouridylase
VKILAAMSGGVDSSVAAAILKKEGYQVIGATMQVWPSNKQAGYADRFGGCCGTSAVQDARRVADKLGIPHYVMNFGDTFMRWVITEFCHEYSLGRTPNPCISCNRYIKFGALLERARELGADFIATGHYARIEKSETDGRYLLRQGIDRRKDQSYVLYRLTQEQLSHARLPVGNFTKERVREIAGEMGLPVSAKPESQEICFIPDNDYPRFLKGYIPEAAEPGPILDKEGTILGKHKGILFYTIGQRKRLGLSTREPLYVTGIDPERNAIIVGSKKEAHSSELIASRLNWIAIDTLRQPLPLSAKIRYLHQEAEAVVIPVDGDHVRVRFNEPQLAVTPGQAIVFYRGDTVVGGGVIERAVD